MQPRDHCSGIGVVIIGGLESTNLNFSKTGKHLAELGVDSAVT